MTNKTDIERRRKLNAELMKERVNFKDDTQCTYEATQNLNPITGKRYEDRFITETDMHVAEQEIKHELKDNMPELDPNIDYFLKPKDMPAFDFPYIAEKYQCYIGAKEKETSTEYLGFQRALAIKEVREGKMSEQEYDQFLDTLDRLVAAYNKSPELTLQTIRDAEGYDLALRKVERIKERDFSKEHWGIELRSAGSYHHKLEDILSKGKVRH